MYYTTWCSTCTTPVRILVNAKPVVHVLHLLVSGCAINEQMVLEYVGLEYCSTSTRASGARVPSRIFYFQLSMSSCHGGLKNIVLELTKLEYQKKWQIPNNFRNSVLLLKISKMDGIWPFWPRLLSGSITQRNYNSVFDKSNYIVIHFKFNLILIV